MGAQVTRSALASRLVVAVVAVLVGATATVQAQTGPQTRVLVVSGAPGSDEYVERQQAWREALVSHLTGRLAVPQSRVTVLAERDGTGFPVATATNVRAALQEAVEGLTEADTFFVVLFGHGTFDGVAAKFNLVGPDLDADEWRAQLRGLRARLVFVQTASASFPFLKTLAAPGRVVITATAAGTEVRHGLRRPFRDGLRA